MSFLRIPVYFVEGDEEKAENLGLDPEMKEGEIVINTKLLCGYNKMDNGNTMLRLANGDCVEAPIDIDVFEDILSEVDSIYELPAVSPN